MEAKYKMYKLQRSPLRSQLTIAYKKLSSELKSDKIDQANLHVLIESVTQKSTKVDNLENQIQNLLLEYSSDSEEIQSLFIKESEDAAERAETVLNLLSHARYCFERLNLNDKQQESISDNEPKVNFNVKLPKYEVMTFSGDIFKYTEWRDNFEVTVNSRKDIPNVQKFAYLRQACKGSAGRAIEGYPTTAENYTAALEVLEERFGQIDIILAAHSQAIHNLSRVDDASNVRALRILYDSLQVNLRGLKQALLKKLPSSDLDLNSTIVLPLLAPTIISRLPTEIAVEWSRRSERSKSYDVDALMEFLCKECECRESLKVITRNNKKDDHKPSFPTNKSFNRSTATALATNANKKCIFCNEDHFSAFCTKFMSWKVRYDKVKQAKACINCLAMHSKLNCTSTKRCKVCGLKHHTLLHRERSPNEQPNQHEPLKDQPQSHVSSVHDNSRPFNHPKRKANVFLQTCLVWVEGPQGRVKTRAFLDGGADFTYIKSDVIKAVGLKPIKSQTLNVSSFGSQSTCHTFPVHEFGIAGYHTGHKIRLTAMETNTLVAPFQGRTRGELRSFRHLNGLQLADDYDQPSLAVDILIGADFIYDILLQKVIKGSYGPVAVESKFGWILHGWTESPHHQVNKSCHAFFVVNNKDAEITNLQDFWNLETVGIESPTNYSHTLKDYVAEEMAKKSISYDGSKYQVYLPFDVEGKSTLNSNRRQAVHRLSSLLTKLQKNSQLANEYCEIIDSYIEEGYCEKVPSYTGKRYLPHHPVLRDDANKTKCRIVFDGSASMNGDTSLNEALLPGPCYVPEIFDVILRFRARPVALTTDIKKAFLNIKISEKDKDYLRFLWVQENDIHVGGIQEYRMCVVPFGLTSSPFLLAFVLQHHLTSQKQNEQHHLATDLLKNIYVDDIVYGAYSTAEAEFVKTETAAILEAASMKLHEWHSNEESLRDVTDTEQSKVLGLTWNEKSDEFFITAPTIPEQKFTKRLFLQTLAKVYDPMGWVAPATTCGKIIMQSIWKQNTDWDEIVGEEIQAKIIKWISLLQLYTINSIPRYYGGMLSAECQLHLFTDASENAYAAIVYLRRKLNLTSFSVSLVACKTRVSPIAKLSICRLELLAMVIGTRLLNRIRQSIDIPVMKTYGWTDSQVALHWSQGSAKNFKVFVANRVRELQTSKNPDIWQHCPGKTNPADLPSRGNCSSAQDLKLWQNGPSWLGQPESEWPCKNEEQAALQSDIDKEVKKTSKKPPQESNVLVAVSNVSDILDTEKYSKLERLLRVTAFVFRFINNCKAKADTRNKGSLSTTELDEAQLYWLRVVQNRSYHDNKDKDKLSNFHPYVDESNIIRSSSRISYSSDLGTDEKDLILLPNNNHFVVLLIEHAHRKCGHMGTSSTLSTIRKKYWIIQGRKSVKKVVKACTVCKRYLATPYDQKEAELPKFRVTSNKPFHISGCDYAGPLYIKNKQKVWICLFTCASVRAVHLELVSDLSSQQFVNAFIRFNARRGPIGKLFCDNATTFKAAKEQLAADFSVQMLFIPPHTPNWGGWWERLIKTTKGILKRVLGRSLISYDALLTILIQTERNINDRPITAVMDDHTVPAPLTPSSFLIGISPPNASSSDCTYSELISRSKHGSAVAIHIWNAWRNKYLKQLISWSKKDSKQTNIPKEGDIVLVNPESVKNRAFWPMGKIAKLLPSRDGFPRVADVIMKGKLIRKPTTKLYPLEVPSESMAQRADLPKSDSGANSTDQIINKPTHATTRANTGQNGDHDSATPQVVTRAGRRVKPPQRLML